jgi:hypothetical protein
MNPYQIIGEVVDKLIKENSFINYEILQDRLMHEFIHISKPDCEPEVALAYETAMKIFTGKYNPKF